MLSKIHEIKTHPHSNSWWLEITCCPYNKSIKKSKQQFFQDPICLNLKEHVPPLQIHGLQVPAKSPQKATEIYTGDTDQMPKEFHNWYRQRKST